MAPSSVVCVVQVEGPDAQAALEVSWLYPKRPRTFKQAEIGFHVAYSKLEHFSSSFERWMGLFMQS
jgi:hypothetical protein